MSSINPLLIGITLGVLFFTGCGTSPAVLAEGSDLKETISTEIAEAVEIPKEKKDPLRDMIEGMTLDEKIGQMVIIGLDGYDVDHNAREMIEKYRTGGFIIFKRNVKDTEQLLILTNSLKEINSNYKIPLFLAVDEEGGSVSRMPESLKSFPTSREIGKENNLGLCYGIGKAIAFEIKAFGFNVNFAPVLDIDSNTDNPVIGDRSFGASPDVVAKLGIEAMKGIESEGVIPVVKHFPGHGDTAEDSHIGLPVVRHNLDRLKGFELLPFIDAIKSDADAVMVAHILLENIDPEYPSSMSKKVITDMLRNDLGFDGVVITDDMMMGAIYENYDLGDAAVRSVLAGSDIILVCHGYENEIKVLDSLKKAAEGGVVPISRIDESLYRIIRLKQKYKLSDGRVEPTDVKKINAVISEVLN